MTISAKIGSRLKLGMLNVFAGVRRRVLGPYAAAVLTSGKNGLLLVAAKDMFVGRHLCFKGSYDHEDIEGLLKLCNSESRVLVVGAHVGALAIPLAGKVAQVDAVEANPETFSLLRMNVMLSGLTNIALHHRAAGDRTDRVSMLVSHLNTGGSKLKMGKWDNWMYVHDNPTTVTVSMSALDELFPDRAFDLIVMDIEGSEAYALRGMQKLLGRSRVLMIEIVEHHLRNIGQVSDQQFLSLIEPHFDEAILLSSPAGDSKIPNRRYYKANFGDLLSDCCQRGSANVLFRKSDAFHADIYIT